MTILMTKKAYERRRRQVVRRYAEMLGNVDCDVGPGWINLASETLAKIVNALGNDMYERSTIIFLGEAKEALRVIVELPAELSDARSKAVDLIQEEAKRSSQKICRQCGADLPVGGYGSPKECDRHESFKGYFKEDYDAHIEGSKSLQESTDIENTPDASSDVVDLNSLEQGDVSDGRPLLQIYNVDDVVEIKRTLRQRTSDSDGRERIKTLCDDMIRRGGERPYSPLPEVDNPVFDNLIERFPNFRETILEVRNAVALAHTGDGRLKLPHMLLLGPPGIGKTMVAQELASAFDTDYIEIRMESEQNGAAIAGSSEFWSNTQVGRVFNALAFGRTANPFITVDEVDKACSDGRYDPLGGLYSLLEEGTAARFEDQSLRGLKVNASAIHWMLTANAIDPVPAPIRSRVQVHEIRPPNFDESIRIAKSIYTTMRQANAWGARFGEALSDAAAEKLAQHEPRKMRSLLLSAFGHAALRCKEIISPDDIPGTGGKTAVTFGFI